MKLHVFLLLTLVSAGAYAEGPLTQQKIARLSHGSTLYLGDNLNSMQVYQDGRLSGLESFENRYGMNPQVFNTLVKSPLTEPFILAHTRPVERTFVYLHGITDSAFQGKDLARELFNAGHNVVVARLSGHGIDSARINQIELSDWRNDVDRAVGQANLLGRKVVLIGLSTGGALAVDRAFRKPWGIEGIVPIAPAIGIANPFVNILERAGLFTTMARVVPQLGSPNTEQTEIRQLTKGSHAVHVLYQLGQANQTAIADRKLFVKALAITSSEDKAIQEDKVADLVADMPNAEWLRIVSKPSQAGPLLTVPGGRLKIIWIKQAPSHSSLVYDPRYAAHQFRVEAAAIEGSRQNLPYVTLNETNPVFTHMMGQIHLSFPNCENVVGGLVHP